MGWMDWIFQKNTNRHEGVSSALLEKLPILPLDNVLFPKGLLPLKQIGQQYRRLLEECVGQHKPIGVCLKKLTHGKSPVHPTGTLAYVKHIADAASKESLFYLLGIERFKVLDFLPETDGFFHAQSQLLLSDIKQPVPDDWQKVLPFLREALKNLGTDKIPEPHLFEEADWVGFRFSEILPISPLARQKLLELDDPLSRLEIIYRYLVQHEMILS